MTSSALNILLVNYDYPPVGGIGTQRIFHFAKYLKQLGHNPVVLTNSHGLGKSQDLTLFNDPCFQNVKTYRMGGSSLIPYHRTAYKGIRNHVYKAGLALRYFWFGQIFYAWYKDCRPELRRLVEEERIHCVWTTAPSYASLYFGRYLKRNLSVPWIIDLRDSMYRRMATEPNWSNRLLEVVNRLWEREFCCTADHIICVSDPMRENMIARVSGCELRPKSSVIPNGYDPDDYEVTPNPRSESGKDSTIHIVYTGTLIGRRKPISFMTAVQELLRSNQELSERIRFTFAGLIDNDIQRYIEDMLDGAQHEFLGFVDRKEVIRLQTSADILLLLTIEIPHLFSSEIMTGKIFEYIGANRPIFATTPPGPLRELIKAEKFGWAADSGNSDDILRLLKQAIDELTSGRLQSFKPKESVRKSFSRQCQAQSLARIMLQLTGIRK